MQGVRLSRVCINGRYGISRGDGSGDCLFSPGIADPLPGWGWLLGRAHPQVEVKFTLDMDGARFSATVNPDAHKGQITREIARAATKKVR